MNSTLLLVIASYHVCVLDGFLYFSLNAVKCTCSHLLLASVCICSIWCAQHNCCCLLFILLEAGRLRSLNDTACNGHLSDKPE